MLQSIQEEIENISWSMLESQKQNEYTLKLSNQKVSKYVLSKYQPQEQVHAEIKGRNVNKETIWIIYGYAFGYPIKAIESEYGPDMKMIVIEPNKKLLEEQFELQGQSYESFPSNIIFFTGYNEVELDKKLHSYILLKDIRNIEWYHNTTYLRCYPVYFKSIGEQIKEYLWTIHIEKNTTEGFAELFLKNIIKNREYIANSYDLMKHKQAYKNIPALVVSAGPSLEKNIHYIKGFKGIIFTGGRSLGAILEQGVQPDFLISLDPADISYDVLGEHGENNFPLITADMSNHKVIKHNTGPKYFTQRIEGMSKELLGVQLESLPMGGSVATLCIGAAAYMGCNPIILIGQDLAYTDQKTHANSCMGKEAGLKEENTYKKIEGYYGDEVVSDPILIYYLRWIESFAENQKDITVINATEGGANIKGTKKHPFESIIEKYRNINKPLLEHKKSEEILDINDLIKKYLEGIKLDLKIIKKGQKLSLSLLEEYEVFEGVRSESIQDILNRLEEEVDTRLVKTEQYYLLGIYLFNKEWAEILLSNHYKEKLNETEIEKGIRVARLSYATYEAFEKCVNKIIEVIEGEMGNE